MDIRRQHAEETIGALRPISDDERRVMVVDDDPDIRNLVKQILEGAGMAVDVAGSAEELYDALDGGSLPRVVVLDLTLPGGSGWNVLDALRANPERAKIDVVILTGRDDDVFREAAKRSGVSAYITKPFQRWELIDAVEERRKPDNDPIAQRDVWGRAV